MNGNGSPVNPKTGESLPRPKSAVASHRRFVKDLNPPKVKKVHAYKLNKKMSTSLKDTIYSGKRKSTPRLPSPTSLIRDSNWIEGDPLFKEIGAMDIEAAAVHNVKLSKELKLDRDARLIPRSHEDVSRMFNKSHEFCNVNLIVDKINRERMEEKLARMREQRRRQTSLTNSPGMLTRRHSSMRNLNAFSFKRGKGRHRKSSVMNVVSSVQNTNTNDKKKKTKKKKNDEDGHRENTYEHLDLLSAEVEFQRVLVQCSENFGHRHPMFEDAVQNLLHIYNMQYLDKQDLLEELKNDPKRHCETVKTLVKLADDTKQAELDHENAKKQTHRVIYLKSKAQSMAEQTR